MTVLFLNFHTPPSSRQYCSHTISFSSPLIRIIASSEDRQSNTNLTEAAIIYKFVSFPYYGNRDICCLEAVKICQRFSQFTQCIEFPVKVVNFRKKEN